MKTKCAALGIVFVLSLAFVAQAGSLDGTKWRIRVTPDKETAAKGEKESDDELIFADGKFTSTACLKYGFAASAYTTEAKGTATKWKSDQTSDKEGLTHWSGQARPTAMSGKMEWVKKDGAKLHYTFVGTKE